MQYNKTSLLHENGSVCDGKEECKNLPHLVTAGHDTCISLDFDGVEREARIMGHLAAIDRQLQDMSGTLVSLSQITSSNAALTFALKLSTVFVHGAHVLLAAAVNAETDPYHAMRNALTPVMFKVESLLLGLK